MLLRTMLLVLAYTGGIGHGVGDIVLFVDPLEEMGHGTSSVHWNIFTSVGSPLRLHRWLLSVGPLI